MTDNGQDQPLNQEPNKPKEPNQPNTPHEPLTPNECHESHAPRSPLAPKPFLPKKGNYRGLLAYQKAECIFDITYFFTRKFLSAKIDRTVDQMVQAARSGKQNIAEGSAAASTSAETELKLTNVARASMQELLTDYEDYLRVRNLTLWPIDDERTRQIKAFSLKHSTSADYMNGIEQRSDETIANIAITLIHQFDALIGRYITRLEKDFTEHGGIREQMTAARLGYRNDQKAEIARLTQETTRLSHDNAYLARDNARLSQETARLTQENNLLKARLTELSAKLKDQ